MYILMNNLVPIWFMCNFFLVFNV